MNKLAQLLLVGICALPAHADDWKDRFTHANTTYWENFNHNGQNYLYYTGGTTGRDDVVDGLHVGGLLGFHWQGSDIDDIGDDEPVYLVNAKTGEYLVFGDYWGTSTMTDHTGILVNIQAATEPREKLANDGLGLGYWICQTGKNETLGRLNFGDGQVGTFEHLRSLVSRSRDEYYNSEQPSLASQDSDMPGGFRWFFQPVIRDGKRFYVIFTHRKTDYYYNSGNASDNRNKIIEYGNRESYLCLTSVGKEFGAYKTDYNSVRFRKFAGQLLSTSSYADERDLIDNHADKLSTISLGNADRFLTKDNGIEIVQQDDANLWKIVTQADRKRYRLVATKNNPVDASYNIVNHKFYTAYDYNVKLSDCTLSGGQYVQSGTATDFGWTWYNDDRNSHATSPHVHPYDLPVGNYSAANELHKIGTGYFYRFGTGTEPDAINATQDPRAHEYKIAFGLESNFCASIYHGTANLQQTITGLRAGRYLVYCRAFYAPHNMERYTSQKETGTLAITSHDYDGLNPAAEVAKLTSSEQRYGRTHDSYLFAWSAPDNSGTKTEVRRMLPSIYEGLTPVRTTNMPIFSKEQLLTNSAEFQYTQLGNSIASNGMNYTIPRTNGITNQARYNMLLDQNIFAFISAADLGSAYNEADYYCVPKNVSGAGRFFNATNLTTHPEANRYRIGLPVVVGQDQTLTIGIDHTRVSDQSNDYEWVCFDEFELIYLGPTEPTEFVIDEDEPFNNTIGQDIWTYQDPANSVLPRKVIIHRSLRKNEWNSLVLPIALTNAQVKEAFGTETQVARLSRLENYTIHFDVTNATAADNDVVVEAGQPYLIKPSADPIIPAGSYYTRAKYSGDYNPSNPRDLSGRYVPGKLRNERLENDYNGRIQGPIYIIDRYDIQKSRVFPTFNGTSSAITIDAATQEWTPAAIYTPNNTRLQVAGDPDNKQYKLASRGSYTNFNVPQYAYIYADGSWYFTGTNTPASKGYRAYVQLLEIDPATGEFVSDGGSPRPFPYKISVNGPRITEVNDDINGIHDLSNPVKKTSPYYDLQGRPVSSPSRRGVYIYNGRKVVR